MTIILVSDLVLGIISVIRAILFSVFIIAGAFLLSTKIGAITTIPLLLALAISVAMIEVRRFRVLPTPDEGEDQ